MKSIAEQVTNNIFWNLKNRRGFDEWFDEIDIEIQEEIKNKMIGFIQEGIEGKPSKSYWCINFDE